MCLDWETFYSKEFTLSKLNTTDYIEDDRFYPTGLGINFFGITKYFYEIDGELFAPDGFHFSKATNYAQLLNSYPWDDINLICHNTAFDGYILHYHYGIHPKFYSDTMSFAKGISFHDSASLAFAARKYGAGKKGKELANFLGVKQLTHEQQRDQKIGMMGYCKQDVDLTLSLYKKFLKYYPESELELIDSIIRMFCEPKLVLDLPRINNYIIDMEMKKYEALQIAMDKWFVSEKELASNPQYSQILERLTGEACPKKPNVKTMKLPPEKQVMTYALSKDDLEYVQFKRRHSPEFDDLFLARAAAKEINELTKSYRIAKHTNGVPVALKYSGAHTKRLSGSNKTNMQALKRGGELRKSLKAPPGYKVIVADLSQIEPRVTAWLAGNQRYLDIFADPKRDIYTEEYNAINGTNITKKDNPNERFVGKQIVISLGYGQGWKKFKSNAEKGALGGPPIYFTEEEAKHLVNGYRKVNWQIPELWDKLESIAYKMMEEETCFEWKGMTITWERIFTHTGLFLHYPNIRAMVDPETNYTNIKYGKEGFLYGGKICENITQHLARNIICEQAVRIKKELGLPIVHMVHDEIITIAPEAEAEKAYEDMIKIMTEPVSWAPNLPLDAEGGIDYCYSK